MISLRAKMNNAQVLICVEQKEKIKSEIRIENENQMKP